MKENKMTQCEPNFIPLARPNSPELDAILGKPYKVLNHGSIRVMDYMGNDPAVVQAARTSYDKGVALLPDGTIDLKDTENLIRYLMRHNHMTPFEMCDLKILVKAPIIVIRQWHRHRTASINEMSARYTVLDKEFYIPEIEHICEQSSSNKQGRGNSLELEQAKNVREILLNDATRNYDNYEHMVKEDKVAKELARLNLTVGHYSQFYWKSNLRNMLNFLRLRMDSHAQFEIRVYAEQLGKIVESWVPFSYAAFDDYQLKSVSLSSKMVELLKGRIDLIAIQSAAREAGISEREFKDYLKAFSK